MKENEAIQLDILLERTGQRHDVLIPAGASFDQLHQEIQKQFGWDNLLSTANTLSASTRMKYWTEIARQRAKTDGLVKLRPGIQIYLRFGRMLGAPHNG